MAIGTMDLELVLIRLLHESTGRSKSIEGGLSKALAVLCRLTDSRWGAVVVSVPGGRWIECAWGESEADRFLLPRNADLVSVAGPITLKEEHGKTKGGNGRCGGSGEALAFPIRIKKRPIGYGVLSGSPHAGSEGTIMRTLEAAGAIIGSFCDARSAGRSRRRPGCGPRREEEIDFLLRLNEFQQSEPDIDGLFRWLCREIAAFVPLTGIEMITLPGGLALRTAGLCHARDVQGNETAAWARSRCEAFLSLQGIGILHDEIRTKEFRLPALEAAVSRRPRGDASRWTWESPLRFGERTLGAIAVRLRTAPAARRRTEKVLAAVSGQIGNFLHGVDDRECIRAMALNDCLTGLFNYRAFQDLFEREFERVLRHGRNLALVMVDLDNFKQINDTFGHQTGDRVLRNAADIIRVNLRKTDYAFRYGGDEFVILMAETDAQRAGILADRIRLAFGREIRGVPPAEFSFSASIGIADCTVLTSNEREELLTRADGALYHAKNAGRNRIRIACRTASPETAGGNGDGISVMAAVPPSFLAPKQAAV